MAKFKPRQRKRRVLDRERQQQTVEPTKDSNAFELIPEPKSEREQRRQSLREQLRAEQTNISTKKQKRLDKYIENKLKKEESQTLLRKLATTRVDTSLLRSVKLLGQTKESKRQLFSRALREKEAGINVEQADRILFDRRVRDDDDGADYSEYEENKKEEGVKETAGGADSASLEFGSGLKRPLELDEDGKPIIKRVKKSSGVKFKVLYQPHPSALEESEESEWAGFSSDGSEGDGHVGSGQTQLQTVENECIDDTSEISDELTNLPQSDSDVVGDSNEDADSDEDSDSSFEEGSNDECNDVGHTQRRKEEVKFRTSAFKQWAEKQRNDAVGFVPSNVLNVPVAPPEYKHVLRPKEEDPLPPELAPLPGTDRKAHAVHVQRSAEIQKSRLELPIAAKEQEIMEAVFNHPVVILSGATGSGKTTQVPQFLFENGYGDVTGPTPGMIGVTQPRRVAAVSMANRVAEELGDAKDRVAYQIRFDSTISRGTAIKFMTDGVLLREMSTDFALKKYSVIIIDEAHERTVNTDILISCLSRCVKVRAQLAVEKPSKYTPLKLIIMSATLRVSDFRENPRLFPVPPPLVNVEGRQFEVTRHWSRKTTRDYVEDSFRKLCRGHRQLPPGGILVFLTGQNEIRTLARRLKEEFPCTEPGVQHNHRVRVSADQMPVEGEDLEFEDTQYGGNVVFNEDEEDYFDGDNDIDGHNEQSEFIIGDEKPAKLSKVHVLPLYSQLPSQEQLKVFKPPPEGSRLIVLATNVAETSLTIPGIRYVFDSGRVKERRWDRAGVQTFETTWISKASADQRLGRAGRTATGHCYRLYSSAMYEMFEDHAEPEIRRSPLESVVLQLKAFRIPNIDNFPFVTQPDRRSLMKAGTLLAHLGALDSQGRLTPLGRELHDYPLNPRFAQMLRLAQLHGCLKYAIAIVAALDVGEIFIPEALLGLRDATEVDDQVWTGLDQQKSQREERRKAYRSAQANLANLSPVSDAIKLLKAVITYSASADPESVCEEYSLRSKAMKEVTKLRKQLTAIAITLNPGIKISFEAQLSKPSEKTVNILRQIVAAAYVDQVAIRADLIPNPPALEATPKRPIDVKYRTLLASFDSSEIKDESDKFVYLHPSSVLSTRPMSKLPAYIVYRALQRTGTDTRKTRMHPLTSISGEQLSVLSRGTTLMQLSKPIGRIGILPAVQGKERRQCSVDVRLVSPDNLLGWHLARKEVVQRREPKEGWVLERYVE